MVYSLLVEEDSVFSPRWLRTAAAYIVVQKEGESPPSTRRSLPSLNDDPSLCATPYTAGGVCELYRRRSPFMKSFRCADYRPIRTGEEQERLVTASPVMTKSRGPSWGRKSYPESGIVNAPRRDTRALSPAGIPGGKVPPRLATQKSRPHAHLGPMRGAPAYFLCYWGE